MLFANGMTEEECDASVNVSAQLAAAMVATMAGMQLHEGINAIYLAITNLVEQTLPRDDLETRAAVAGVIRHAAAHVDLTCPHMHEGEQNFEGSDGGPLPPPSNRHLH